MSESIDDAPSWSWEVVQSAWVERAKRLQLWPCPTSSGGPRLRRICEVGGVEYREGPYSEVRTSDGGYLFSAWLPAWAVMVYKAKAARSTSLNFTDQDAGKVLSHLKSDPEGQKALEVVAALSGIFSGNPWDGKGCLIGSNDAVFGWITDYRKGKP